MLSKYSKLFDDNIEFKFNILPLVANICMMNSSMNSELFKKFAKNLKYFQESTNIFTEEFMESLNKLNEHNEDFIIFHNNEINKIITLIKTKKCIYDNKNIKLNDLLCDIFVSAYSAITLRNYIMFIHIMNILCAPLNFSYENSDELQRWKFMNYTITYQEDFMDMETEINDVLVDSKIDHDKILKKIFDDKNIDTSVNLNECIIEIRSGKLNQEYAYPEFYPSYVWINIKMPIK